MSPCYGKQMHFSTTAEDKLTDNEMALLGFSFGETMPIHDILLLIYGHLQ